MSIEGEISGDYDEGSNFSEESLSQAGSDYSPEFEDKKEHKAKYQVITEQKRQRLIDCVEQRKISISKAAKRVGIKYSTAKTIYAIYLREGRVTTKLGRNMKSANSENTEMKKSKTKTPKKRRVPKKSEESVSFEKGEMFTTRPETRAASKNSQSAKSNLICKIKELQPPAHEEAPRLVKKIKKEETDAGTTEDRTPENGTERMLPRQDQVLQRKDALIENQLLLSQLNSLLGMDHPLAFMQAQMMNAIANYRLPMLPGLPYANYLLKGMAVQDQKPQMQPPQQVQQLLAASAVLNKMRTNF